MQGTTPQKKTLLFKLCLDAVTAQSTKYIFPSTLISFVQQNFHVQRVFKNMLLKFSMLSNGRRKYHFVTNATKSALSIM